MTSPDATNSGADASSAPVRVLDRDAGRNHHPIWAVRTSDDRIHRVYACDEEQARRWALATLGLIVVAVWLADD